jgi:hypothetical protein
MLVVHRRVFAEELFILGDAIHDLINVAWECKDQAPQIEYWQRQQPSHTLKFHKTTRVGVGVYMQKPGTACTAVPGMIRICAYS